MKTTQKSYWLCHALNFFLIFNLQAQSIDGFRCYTEFDPNQNFQLGPGALACNGQELTPRGNQKFLLVFAGFEGFEGPLGNNNFPLSGWDNSISNNFQLPSYVTFQNGETRSTKLFYNLPGDFDDSNIINNVENQKSVSYILNLMSKPNQDFRFFGEVFTNEQDEPILVTIDPNISGLNGWASANEAVIEEMMQIRDPSVNNNLAYWQSFNQRTNRPLFMNDNSVSLPDNAIDYIVIVYRFDPGWSIEPVTGIDGWPGSGGGVYNQNGITGSTNYMINNFTFNSGITVPIGKNVPYADLLHEFSHSAFFAPHYGGANGVFGEYFYQAASGTGSTCNHIFEPQFNGWERWLMGYIDPIEPTQNTTIVLNDFVTTGEAIRIPIPNTNGQNLWIENHTGNHVLDGNRYTNLTVGPNGVTLGSEVHNGVHMYIEDIRSTKAINDARNDIFVPGANGIKPINASGNWEFDLNIGVPPVTNNGGGVLYRFSKESTNVVSGINPWMKYVYNIDDSDNIIQHTDPALFEAPNGGSSEGAGIYREYSNGVDNFPYRAWSAYVNNVGGNPLFEEGEEIGINTNPMMLNYPEFNEGGEEFDPFILNGICVNIISIDQNGVATIQIRFDDIEVDQNVTWKGNISLPDISNDNNDDLIIAAKRQLTLDLSETVNRWTISPETNDFINPTKLTISSGSKLHMLESSIIIVKGGSKLIIEDGAEVLLEDKACILVEPDGVLEINGNEIHLDGKDAVIIVKGKLITAAGVDFTFTGPGYVDFHSTHILSMGNGSNFVLSRTSGSPGYQDRFIRIRDNTTVNIEDRIIDLQGGAVYYDNDTKLRVSNSAVIFNETIFSDLDEDLTFSGYNSIGLEGINLTSCNIQNSTFEYFDKGVMLTGNTSIPYFESNNFTHNRQGLVADNMNMIILKDNNFISNFTDGVNLQFIDIAKFHGNWIELSNNGCNFKNVMSAHLVGTHISQCTSNGVLAEKTNVFLKDDGEILNNNVGVRFVNNSTATYMLSVGKCGCAKIINNNIGVKGDNIILDIDRIEHEFECNIFPLEPSRFDGNTTIFDICYSTTTSPYPLNILMRGNYWGGGAIGTNYNIKNGTLCTGDNVTINASEYATSYGDCESPGIVSDTPSNFPPGLEDDIKCEVLDGSTVIEVHEQSRLAYYDFHHEDFINAETKYTPVSNLNVAVINDPICVNKIHIARCIVDAIQNDQYATPNSYWLDSAQRPKHLSDLEITVYPNPTSGSFRAYSEKNRVYHLQIFNVLGELIKTVEFARETEINIGQFKKGLYILQFNTADGAKLQVEKLMVE